MNRRLGPWPTDHKTAVALGTLHYFTARPCKRGHVDLRVTRTLNCLACKREADRERSLVRLRLLSAAETPEKRRERQKTYNSMHRDQRNAKKRETREFERFMRQLQDEGP